MTVVIPSLAVFIRIRTNLSVAIAAMAWGSRKRRFSTRVFHALWLGRRVVSPVPCADGAYEN